MSLDIGFLVDRVHEACNYNSMKTSKNFQSSSIYEDDSMSVLKFVSLGICYDSIRWQNQKILENLMSKRSMFIRLKQAC